MCTIFPALPYKFTAAVALRCRTIELTAVAIQLTAVLCGSGSDGVALSWAESHPGALPCETPYAGVAVRGGGVQILNNGLELFLNLAESPRQMRN